MPGYVVVALFLIASQPPVSGAETLQVQPASIVLSGADSRQQLLVTATLSGREFDATDQATFQSSDPTIAIVGRDGVVLPVADGVAKIEVVAGGQSASVDVKVVNAKEVPSLHFGRDIIPLLTKAGCNSGSCHGKQSGLAGFKLSVFGHDIKADYAALVSEGRGRRIFPGSSRESLLLQKAVNRVPHGGGRRVEPDSPEYRRMLRWIEAGLPEGDDNARRVVRIDVQPRQRVMSERSRQRLLVTAALSDGTTRDVTNEAAYISNDDTLATVDKHGRISTASLGGESAVVVRYQEHVAASLIMVPINQETVGSTQLAKWDRSHFIDRLVADKWELLQLSPSPPADDATFHRRVFLDLTGRLPTAAEVREFLADNRTNKRARLVDVLLKRPEYADYQALKWADLLRINRQDLGAKPAWRYHQWLRRSFERNQPYDEFLRELVTAQGNSQSNGAVNFFRAFKNPNDLTVAVSQVFLGVRLDCAKCHHHPYEKWSQDDFYGLAAFFPRVKNKKSSGGSVRFFIADKGDVKHPQTKEIVLPRVLLGKAIEVSPGLDARSHLADWLAAKENPFVARSLVNRVWAHLMGRGLVEPIDDMRETNPPTNEPLLNALAQDFVAHNFDIQHLLRTITTSKGYGLSSQPNDDNVRDTQNYSRAFRKRLGAEVLLDAVCDVTEEPEQFAGLPPGIRAVQLWDNRLPSAFLDTFGRPQRKTVCQCERLTDTTLSQVLHLMNAPPLNDKISSPTGRTARLANSDLSQEEIVVELYLVALGRPPRDAELKASLAAFKFNGATRRRAAEDILWALINSAEFVLNH